MKARRDFIKKSMLATLASVGGFSMAKPAISRSIKEFSMAMSWPKASPGPALAAQYFADELSKASDGRLRVQLYGAGELVPGLEVFDATSNHGVDMAHSASFYWSGKLPGATLFTTVPFGLSPAAHQAWLQEGGGNPLWQKLYGDFNLIPMAAGNTGTHMAGWFTRPMHGLDDIKGLKIRMAGLGAELFRQMGATTMLLPPSQITPSLASGLIDGAEFLGPWIDSGFGFQKYANYYYAPGFNKPNGTSELLINASLWQSLPASDQALITQLAKATHDASLNMANWQNALHYRQLNPYIHHLPQAVMDKAAKLAPDILAAAFDKDKQTQTLYESYKQAQKHTNPWLNI